MAATRPIRSGQGAPVTGHPAPKTTKEEVMAHVEDERGLTQDELMQEDAEQLPDREAMSLINANLAIPVNAAVAANVLSDNATAYADAAQTTPITQTS